MRKIITYLGHEIEIATRRTGWKQFRAVFLDIPQEKPVYGWTEYEVTELAKWTIANEPWLRAPIDPTGRMI